VSIVCSMAAICTKHIIADQMVGLRLELELELRLITTEKHGHSLVHILPLTIFDGIHLSNFNQVLFVWTFFGIRNALMHEKSCPWSGDGQGVM